MEILNIVLFVIAIFELFVHLVKFPARTPSVPFVIL